MTDHFLSVAQMIDDLRADDKELRLVAVKALVTIAQTLGPERTREELIPYLTDYLDEDDSVLRSMASRFGAMLAEVGGIGHIDCLLTPLETLCTLDEISVRDEAIASINALAKTAFGAGTGSVEAQSQVVGLVQRLATAEHAPSRCSACGLIAGPYPVAPLATKRELKSIFGKLCEDGEVMVRRAACVALGGAVTAALNDSVGEFLGHLSKFCKDTSDGVRLQTVNAAIAMCPLLAESGVTQVIGLMKALASDAAWRVRFMLADRLGALVATWPAGSKVGLAMFRTLCNDAAPEIKAAAVFNLDQIVVSLQSDEAARDALDVAVRLADDATAHVRSCLGSVLLKALPHLPRATWQGTVVPTATKLLQDSESQVRLAVVGSFSQAGTGKAEGGLSQVATTMTPVIVSLAQDASWRVRETVVQQLPAVVQGGADLTVKLVDVCVEALSDRVATIRIAAATACRQLVARQGGAWMGSELLPRINTTLGQSKNYMHRVTLLYVIRQLLEVVDEKVTRAELWPVLLRMSADPIANVRMNAAHAIRTATQLRRLAAGDVDTTVNKLRADPDADVRDAMVPPTR